MKLGKRGQFKEIERLKQEIALLKNALCSCPHDGKWINCPIHGYKMYGDGCRFPLNETSR